MPFVRFSRDRRGYEHTYLLHIDHKRGQSQARVLYWFRTPPNVQVGREVFDADTRRRLEAVHPDVIFDWAAITKSLETTVDQLRAGDRGSGVGDRGGKAGKRKVRGKEARTARPAEAGAAPPASPPPSDEPQL